MDALPQPAPRSSSLALLYKPPLVDPSAASKNLLTTSAARSIAFDALTLSDDIDSETAAAGTSAARAMTPTWSPRRQERDEFASAVGAGVPSYSFPEVLHIPSEDEDERDLILPGLANNSKYDVEGWRRAQAGERGKTDAEIGRDGGTEREFR